MISKDFQETIEALCGDLLLDEGTFDLAATIRPVTIALGATIASDEPEPETDLPSISLAFDGQAESAGAPSESLSTSDLQILSTIGEGGMGRILLARQHSLEREVAVKMLKPGASATHRAALLGEALVAGSLEHPGIIPVHALGLHEGDPVLVMKRVEGVEWGRLLSDPEHEAWAWVAKSGDRLVSHLEIFMQICNAVQFAHSRGIVHRDIKPDNVMIGRFGAVYLVDWGIAGIVGEYQERLSGSPGYLAPEMIGSTVIDVRTDVYLLGSTLHEILTGEPRHQGDELVEVLASAFNSEPVEYGDEIPTELAQLCNQATSLDPANRPQSVLEMQRAIAEYLHHRGSLALAALAEERLVTLETLVEACKTDVDSDDVSTSYRVFSECRFGFVHALREWPENPTARAGLERCSRAMIELMLRQHNAPGARALLSELGEPDSEITGRLEVIEAEVRAQSERELKLKKIEHDQDQSIGAGPRALVAASLLVLALGLNSFIQWQGSIDVRDMAIYSSIVLLIAISGLAIFRKRLLGNEFSRNMVAIVVVIASGILLNRLVSVATEASSATTFTRDMVIVATVMASVGFTVSRAFLGLSSIFVLGLVVSVIKPELAQLAFSLGIISSSAALLYLWSSASTTTAQN